MDKAENLRTCGKATSNIASTSEGCVSEEPNRPEGSFQTNEVNITAEEIQNLYIYQRPVVPSYPKDNVSEENVAKFLRSVDRHIAKQTDHIESIDTYPRMMLLDMDSSKPITSSSMNSKTDFFLGRDVEEIQMHDFHSNVNGKAVRHVMILGEAGAGKSTLSRNYFAAVKNRLIDSLKHIEMVLFVNAFDLVSDTTSKIFNLFFTHQMAGDPQTELTSELRDAGLYWVQNNSGKMLVIIDGLDQYSAGIGGKRYPKIDETTPAFPDTVLTNLFSGNIWPNALILTTSRWSVFWELMNHQKPDKVVGLRGFDDLNMEKAAQNIIPESSEKMLSYIRNASPKLFALCQNPMFLSYTSRVYQRSDADLPDTISGLMAEVFSDFMHSSHHGNPDLESVTKLAYYAWL